MIMNNENADMDILKQKRRIFLFQITFVCTFLIGHSRQLLMKIAINYMKLDTNCEG